MTPADTHTCFQLPLRSAPSSQPRAVLPEGSLLPALFITLFPVFFDWSISSGQGPGPLPSTLCPAHCGLPGLSAQPAAPGWGLSLFAECLCPSSPLLLPAHLSAGKPRPRKPRVGQPHSPVSRPLQGGGGACHAHSWVLQPNPLGCLRHAQHEASCTCLA